MRVVLELVLKSGSHSMTMDRREVYMSGNIANLRAHKLKMASSLSEDMQSATYSAG